MHQRTKATSIPPRIKYEVWVRDGHKCVGCGRYAHASWACAHYIARSQGGVGNDARNIFTACPSCHEEYDNSPKRHELKEKYGNYLHSIYGDFDEQELIYDKWRFLNEQ